MTAGSEIVHVVGAAIIKGGLCLAAQRGPSMSLAGKWEFPGGKIEPGEAPQVALARELREELGIEAEVGAWLGRGDSIENGQRVCLDVYLAETEVRQMNLHEHAAVSWLSASDLYQPDWAAADIPILPALHAHMVRSPHDHHCRAPVALLAADWGKERRKRAVYSAEFSDGWKIERLTHSEGWTVGALLDVAHGIQARSECAVLLGIDVSLGAPASLIRRTKVSTFIDFVDGLRRCGGLEEESLTAAEWCPEKPFFRIPPVPGGKHSFFEAAGGESVLLRQIELRTGGNPTFALSGIPGTVGSGTREVWRELSYLLNARTAGRDFCVWPFEGDLTSLLARKAVVLGEIYPRAAYAVALSDKLPTPPEPIAKTRPKARVEAIRRLEAASWVRDANLSLPDLTHALQNEDDFDALLTVVAMVREVAENRPLSCSLVDRVAEGGILATGDVEIPTAPYRARRGPRPTGAAEIGRKPTHGRQLRCPVPGCSMTFQYGRSGWDAHAASTKTHPNWRSDLVDGEDRKSEFRKEFATWFAR